MRRAAERVAEGYTEVSGAAPTRPGSSGRPPRPTPAVASPPRHRRRAALLRPPRPPAARGAVPPEPPTVDADLRRIRSRAQRQPGAGSAAPRSSTIPRRSTSAACRSPTKTSRRSSSTGGPRSPSPSTGRPRSSRWACARRRHFQTQGRRLLGIDDEVFDAEATAASGFTVVGEGALLAALDQERTGRMRDIVATIQAEQDEAIRADSPGSSSCRAVPAPARPRSRCTAPRTSSTRTASASPSQGVLLVGPSPIFLRYIDEVLPSLGEDEVTLATPASLKPRLRVAGAESEAAAAVKGDVRMAKVIAAAIGDRERPMPRDVIVTLDGYRLRLRRRDSRRIVERTRAAARHAQRAPPLRRRCSCSITSGASTGARWSSAYRRERARLDPESSLGPPDRAADRGRRRPHRGAGLARGEPAPPEWEDELTTRRAAPARGARGARADVAGAQRRRVGARPVRIRGADPVGGATACSPTRSSRRCPAPRAAPRRERRRQVGVDRRRPPAGRRSRRHPRSAQRRPGPRARRRARRDETLERRAAPSTSSASVGSPTPPT